MVIARIKWDAEKDTMATKRVLEEIRRQIAPFNDVPIFFTFGAKRQRMLKVLDSAMAVYENRSRKYTTSQLHVALLPAIKAGFTRRKRGSVYK